MDCKQADILITDNKLDPHYRKYFKKNIRFVRYWRKKKMIKQIFSDMDGTILNKAGKINPNTAKFLKNYPIPITLVSARAPMEMESTINELNLTGPQLAFNTGLIFEKMSQGIKKILSNPIPHDLAIKIITFIKQKFSEAPIS